MKVISKKVSLLLLFCLLGNTPLAGATGMVASDSNSKELLTSDSSKEIADEELRYSSEGERKNVESSNLVLESEQQNLLSEDKLEKNVGNSDLSKETDNSDISESLQREVREGAIKLSEQILMQRKVPEHVNNFINSLLPVVNNISNKYNLYSSVMLAQASLESGWGKSTLSVAPNYNLFGVKWSGQGAYVEMITNEEIDGEMVEVLAKFQKYDNYEESLVDYAKKIRNGPSWDSNYYSGVWKENAQTYKEATYYLTGRYATDSQYHVKLNSIISNWGYDLYDKEFATYKITGTNLNKKLAVANTDYYFYTEPYRTLGSIRDEKIGVTYKLNETAIINKAAVTSLGTKVYYVTGFGWIDQRAFREFTTIKRQEAVNKELIIVNGNYLMYQQPYQTEGAVSAGKLINKVSLGTKVKASKYTENNKGIKNYYIDGFGWIDHRAFLESATISSQINLQKHFKVKNANYNIYTAPYRTQGMVLMGQLSTKYKIGDDVEVLKFAKTSKGTQTYYIKGLGWVDYRSLKEYPSFREDTSFKAKNMKVKRTAYNIYSAPYLTIGMKKLGHMTDKYKVGSDVRVTRTGVTSLGNKVSYIDKVGWVSTNSLENYATFKEDTSFKTKNMRVKRTAYNIYSAPYLTVGMKKLGHMTDKYKVGSDVRVTRTGVTNLGNKVSYIDKVGWVSTNSLENYATISKTENVNLTMVVSNLNYNLYSNPYNTYGMKKISAIKDKYKVGSSVTVTKLVTTSQGVKTYYIKNVGWVDYRSLTAGQSAKMKKVQSLLTSKYNSKNYGIYVKSLADGSSAGVNATTKMTAASTGKLPALYYTQKQIKNGKINANTRYLYTDKINQMTNAYMRGGSGVLQNQRFNQYFSIDQIMNWTAKYSDNQGTNFIAYYACNKYDSKMKAEISSIIGRSWSSPFSVSPIENAKLMEAIYRQGGQVVGYLQNTVYDNQRIPKYLPVKVAHKIGDVNDYRHDVGIVYASQPYVISVMTKNYISYETISKLSLEVYNLLK